MKESSLWKWLKRGTSHLSPSLHMTRVEDLSSVGRPDVEACYLGKSFVIELKVALRPARESTPIRLQSPITSEQVSWLRMRRQADGTALILLQVGLHKETRRYLIDGGDAEAVRSGLPEVELAERSWCLPTADAETLIKSAACFNG